MFPHHYGPLTWSAVVNQARIKVAADGDAELPDWVV
jgi:uncharacterized protein (DUF952 family)